MVKHFATASLILLGAMLTSFAQANEWTHLLDAKLSQFDVWLGVPDSSVTGLSPGTLTRSDRKTGQPLGLNHDPKHVFSIITEDGHPVLKVTGEVYGAAVTRQEYANYHFSCQMKFGAKKWPPREKAPSNAGVLYHSTGPHGAANNAWMRSFEFQGMEGRRGDLYRVAGTDADVRTTPRDPANPKAKAKWDPAQPPTTLNPVEHSGDYDSAPGEWTTLEIYALGRQSVHVVNGHVVLALDNARLKDGTPLSAGKIQLQSEGAEVYYRDVRIQPITEFPEEIQKASGLSATAPAFTGTAKAAVSPGLTPGNLTCQGLVNPQGLDAANPGLSWISVSTDAAARGQIQTAYQILVADSQPALGKNFGNLWDSGKVMSEQSAQVAYAGKPLSSHQACYWKVRVWNRDGLESAWSQAGSWTMGFIAPDKWQPNWIGNEERTPLLRKEFKVVKPVKRAWVYASALGIYELRFNGSKVGSDLFAPGWTDYRQRLQYQRYDVTDRVKSGANVMGAEIAPGWFAGNIAWFSNNRYGKQVAFAAELHLEFADGSTQIVATDGTWKAIAGPLTASDIQDGDQYDARLEKTGWDKPGYNDSNWMAAAVMTGENRNLVAQSDQPVGVVREMKPLKVTEPAPGVFVYDLGQNITGVARIAVKAAKGTTITLRFAERLNANGTLDVTNLKQSKATDTYITSGNGLETFQPKFTFHGFRWISIEGLEKAPALADVTGVVIGSRFSETGSLLTSNPDLNHLLSNIRWTIHNSYLSVPMDSPQRSERLGWTGDANVMAATATWFFGLDRFYSKWERDILDGQVSKESSDLFGGMPNVAPRWMQKEVGTGGGWGDVGVNLPYVLWQRYGNTDIIRSSYSGMKNWVSYMKKKSDNHIIPVKAQISKAGDWENASDDTPKDLVGTFYYALDVAQLAEMAAAIGNDADATAYRQQFQEIRAAIIKKFVAPDGTVAKGSQTAQVFALYLGLYPDGMKDKVFAKLLENIKAHNGHLTTGYLGSQWLLHVLVANGRADVAYQILLQKTGPSWLFMAGNGQTSLWEGWNSLNPDGTFGPTKRTSLGHSALGSCGDWMFQGIGGLIPDPASPGFKHFTIRPIPGGALTNAELRYQSPQGQISSRWTLKDDHFNLEVEVPVNATATLVLPTANTASITEGGRPVATSPGVVAVGTAKDSATFKVGSGRYFFTAVLPHRD